MSASSSFGRRVWHNPAAITVLALLPLSSAGQHFGASPAGTQTELFAARAAGSAESFLAPTANSLPEAPQPNLVLAHAVPVGAAGAPEHTARLAPKHWKYIPAGYTAQPIDGHDKLIIGERDIVSTANLLAIVFSAGWEQLTDTQPNYGVDSAAFGQRIGAGAIRDSAQGFLTDGIFSQVFHQDTRYWVRGPGHSIAHRAGYAISRVVVSKTDDGRPTFNTALWVGYAAVSALNNAYYPNRNRNVQDNVVGYFGSLGGAALGYLVSEFSDQALEAVHLRKR